ncbi:MAG: hypothetical protein ACRC6M_19605 [Microcystaceae cyanobacterium]
MQSIRLRSLIGKNGLLQIQLPETTEGTELDIILVYESASPTNTTKKLSDFYGCIQDETFIRHPLESVCSNPQ